MKAGNYGNLLVQIEQPRGEYAVTIAFLRLLTTLVKVPTTCFLSSHSDSKYKNVFFAVTSVPLPPMSRVSLAALRTKA